jgi:hypothetical protein
MDRCKALAQATRQGPNKPFAIFCVAIADEPDDLAVEEAQWGKLPEANSWQREKTVLPFPLVLDAQFGQLHYFQELPFYAHSYYALFRKTIHRCLLPEHQPAGAGRSALPRRT